MYMSLRGCVHVCPHVFVRACAHACTHLCMWVHARLHVCVLVRLGRCVYVCTQAPTHAYMYLTMCIPIHIYIYVCTWLRIHDQVQVRIARDWSPNRRWTRFLSEVFRQLADNTNTMLPSGQRRWLKPPFLKGVSSNPTAVTFTCRRQSQVKPRSYLAAPI